MHQSSDNPYWLILSHSFNQDGQASSLTITDKLPYLLERGIDIAVLSGVMGSHDSRFTHKQLLPWGPSGFGFDMRQLMRQHWGRDWRYKITSFFLSIFLFPFVVLEYLIFGFQSQWSWALSATFHALRLIRRRRPAIIYSSGGAYSAHLAGYWINKLTGISWIAEVHDPMVVSDMKQNRNSHLLKKIEGAICSKAELAWWFTDEALSRARKRHPELGNRGVVILPGVEKLPSDAVYQRTSHMVIAHFGLLSDSRSMLPVVQAIASLLAVKPEIRTTLRVHIYGSAIDNLAKAEIERLELDDLFIGFGRLEYSPFTGKSGREQVIDRMYQADCLLLLHGNFEACREYIPSKFYEYLWASRPIIALTHLNTQLDQMLRDRGSYFAAVDQPEAIVDTIACAYADWQRDSLRMPTLPAISIKQAVDSIFHALAPKQESTSVPVIDNNNIMFSIIIPTWNNLPFLKICIESLRKYSALNHEIIVHVNEGTDGTLEWVKAEGLKYSRSERNTGVCMAVNYMVDLASHDWVLYLNDDMVACPGWDTAFIDAITSTQTDLALFFSTLIQPKIGKNQHMIEHDFGSTPETFDADGLLKHFNDQPRSDAEGAASQPTLFHRKWWQAVGGYSLEFSPGMSSDDDLLMKYWVAGCRHFRVVGASRFYHFVCQSTGRLKHTKGGRVFVMKWGMTQGEFYNKYMAALSGTPPSQLISRHSQLFPRATLVGKLRRAGYGLFQDYPLQGIEEWDPTSCQGKWEDSQ
ncbi:MAG: glycosyltransferase [Gallionellaceae bacterium]